LKPTLFYSQQQLSLTAPLQIARDLRSISDILVLLTSNIVAFCPWSVSWLLCFLDTGSKEFPCSSRRLLPFPMQVCKIKPQHNLNNYFSWLTLLRKTNDSTTQLNFSNLHWKRE
jgi:hypothetical protein